MSSLDLSYLRWPGKSPTEGSDLCHSAVYHMLDVGAVFERLVGDAGFGKPLRQALTFLATLHDLGKIGAEFCAAIETDQIQAYRHWELTEAWLLHFDGAVFAPRLGGKPRVREQLYAAIAGHHGQPPQQTEKSARMRARAGNNAERDARATVEAIAVLFPEMSLEGLEVRYAKTDSWDRASSSLSWWLAGFTTVADWIGSNTDWFPAHPPDLSVEAYWPVAQAHAERAAAASGLAAAAVSQRPTDGLFALGPPRPMQKAVLEADLPAGQTLALIEDATGSGKTEAALMLAHRMMRAGKGDGLFFALPTMATANAMFGRLRDMRALFDGDPSLALAHGRAALHDGFREIVGRRDGEPDAIACSEWLADGRRKALLADIGVGTIDQALLGVLPTRFFALRLYALSRRILIVDEAHDYDPYMQQELEQLLTFHAMFGGSAILMTATLPEGMRDAFVKAFAKGAKRTPMGLGTSYPQLSVVGEAAVSQTVEPVPATRREVGVERVGSLEAALDLLVEAAARGAACAFVRNSVDEAIAAVEALQVRGVDVMLHHARFALTDRLANEQVVLSRFGREGDGRAGAVIVGTQVLEQSLDIDFDIMVSDLAPIGALIQRAGRLWRHMDLRPETVRPESGPTLHVLSPDPDRVANAKWSFDLLGRGAHVYFLDDQWRTARVLFEAGMISAPNGLKVLIEAVHGEDRIDLPDPLKPAEMEHLGGGQGERQLAKLNVLEPFADYGSVEGVGSGEDFPTRLGEEQVALVLARRTPAGLVPWAEGEASQRTWALSEVMLSRRRWQAAGGVDQSAPEIFAAKADWPKWRRESDSVILCPVGDDGAVADDLRYDREKGLIATSPNSST